MSSKFSTLNVKHIFTLRSNVVLLLISLTSLLVPTSSGSESTRTSTLSSNGIITYLSGVDITINVDRVVDVNNFSLGFQVDYPWEWKAFRDRSVQRQLADDANFKLVRFFDSHLGYRGSLDYSKGVGPCSWWNEATKTGTFDWTDVDSLVNTIFDIGAEPLICLSRWPSAIPPGMAINPSTLLPYPDSYAAFAAAWVQHFKNVGLPVRYYEIFNEIQTYIGWNWNSRDETRTTHFIELFNAAYQMMHETNSQVIVSFDASTLKWVFPELLSHGVGIDSFNFHKYDDWKDSSSAFNDQKMFRRAEEVYFQVEDDDTYTLDYVRDVWLSQRGVMLPAILSEGNWNAHYGPTDERIQQMAGAVRTALVLRMCILKGVSYNIYYTLNSDATWERATYGSGNGFGMIDCDSRHTTNPSYDNPWYPYYVQKIVGENLASGDAILETANDSEHLRVLAWSHDSTLNILLISTATQSQLVHLKGVSGDLQFFQIDDTISYTSPSVQEGTMNAGDLLILNGYTVILLQSDLV